MDLVGQQFLRVVRHLIGEPASGRLLELREHQALVELRRDRVVVLLCATSRVHPSEVDLRALVERNTGVHLDIAVLGGGAQTRAAVASAQPRFMMRRIVRAYHLDEAGALWTGRSTRRDSPVAEAIEAAARSEEPAVDREQLERRVVRISEEERAALHEHRAFLERFRARPATATWAALLTLVAVFTLQALWGGTRLVPTLVRMGANIETALGGEPWRVLSSSFLHAGPWHLAINAYVLFAFGSFLERVLGWSRFVLLYGAAALGGGVASAAFLDERISVGASGAIAGLFGAAAALAWREDGLLPRRLVTRIRRITVINLLINLPVSFLPQVDIMAHVGGALVGAGLVASGLITRGLPAIDAGKGEAGPIPGPRWPAVLTTAILYGSLVVAWAVDRPWTLGATPRWSTIVLEPEVQVELPESLGAPVRESGRPGERVWSVGDLLRDPMQIVVSITPAVELQADELDVAVAALRGRAFAAGAQSLGERDYPDAPGVVWEQRFAVSDDALRAFRLVRLEHAEVLVEIVWWIDAPGPWPDAVVERVLGSFRPFE